MAGSIALSLTQQFDNLGNVLSGGKMYFIQAGTVAAPQNAYQDLGLTNPWPNPYELLANGRVPLLYFADGFIKVRITDKLGNQVFNQDNIPVTGPSSGGGGGGAVDPTTVLATGDLKVRYGTGVLSGFVRANARTIGSVASGATERANADTQALFEYLWAADPNLAVSTGRGGSANADWVANKNIALPDYRGRALAGLDDMGASAAGRLTATYFGTAATVLGAAGGLESQTLTLAQLPTGITSTNPAQSISVLSARTYPATSTYLDSLNNGGGAAVLFWRPNVNASPENISSSGNNSISVTSNNTSGSAHRTVQPTLLVTIYIKL